MSFPEVVPQLDDGVARLRAHRPGDVDAIVDQAQDPDMIRWTTIPQPYAAPEAREFLASIAAAWSESSGLKCWAIASADDPDAAYLGTIDIRPQGAGIGELGFGLHPRARGRHLMTAAVRLVVRWWFEQGGVRVFWRANRGNFASWRVAWACGFRAHSQVAELLPHRGEALDAWVASVGRGESLDGPAASWNEPAPLAGDRLGLRAWREADAAWCEPAACPAHFVPAGTYPTADRFAQWLLDRRERMSRGESTHWCIVDTEDRPLGEVLLIEAGEPEGSAQLGYKLFPSARGRGVATAAARLVLAHAFAPAAEGGRALRRLTAVTVGDNAASARVLGRLGFRRWGVEPAFCVRADGSFDEAHHWVCFPG